MAKKCLFLGMLAKVTIVTLVLAFGLMVVGCDNGTTDDDDGGGTGDSALLVGKWKAQEDKGNNVAFEFKSDGTVIMGEDADKYTYKGTTLTLIISGSGTYSGTAVLSDSNKTLTLTFTGDAASMSGVYTKIEE
jgi:hypothetical protein